MLDIWKKGGGFGSTQRYAIVYKRDKIMKKKKKIVLSDWSSTKNSQNRISFSAFSFISFRLSLTRFVVDAADHDKLDAARTELKSLLEKPQLANIPVLVLGNKNDLPGALNVEQLIDVL